MKQVRAIPQRYRDVVYRSRTEARWAFFFDLTGTPYQYEAEGFQLGSIWYVPDFWLGHADVHFEVKGQSPSEIEMKKAVLLAEQSGCPVVIAQGNPSLEVPLLIVRESGECGRCFVVQDHDSLGAWIAQFADGGGWAFPLRADLKNCAAYGEQHESLKEAAALQFGMTPEMENRQITQALQRTLGDWHQVGVPLWPIIKSARKRMQQQDGDGTS